MKRKDLENLELEPGVIDQIMTMHGKAMGKISEEKEAATTNVQTLQEQLNTAQSTIEGFKELDVDSIKAAANDYKAKYEEAQAEAEKQIASLKFDHSLEAALTAAKAKNAKSVKALLDLEKLKLTEDGKIDGLESQLEAIRKENDFLFSPTKPEPRIIAGGGDKRDVLEDSTISAAREAAGLTE